MIDKVHQKRHTELHKALDELMADWIDHNMTHGSNKGLSNTSIMELMPWSYEQTKKPTEKPK